MANLPLCLDVKKNHDMFVRNKGWFKQITFRFRNTATALHNYLFLLS